MFQVSQCLKLPFSRYFKLPLSSLTWKKSFSSIIIKVILKIPKENAGSVEPYVTTLKKNPVFWVFYFQYRERESQKPFHVTPFDGNFILDAFRPKCYVSSDLKPACIRVCLMCTCVCVRVCSRSCMSSPAGITCALATVFSSDKVSVQNSAYIV